MNKVIDKSNKKLVGGIRVPLTNIILRAKYKYTINGLYASKNIYDKYVHFVNIAKIHGVKSLAENYSNKRLEPYTSLALNMFLYDNKGELRE